MVGSVEVHHMSWLSACCYMAFWIRGIPFSVFKQSGKLKTWHRWNLRATIMWLEWAKADWNSNILTWKNVNSGVTSEKPLRGGVKCDAVSWPGASWTTLNSVCSYHNRSVFGRSQKFDMQYYILHQKGRASSFVSSLRRWIQCHVQCDDGSGQQSGRWRLNQQLDFSQYHQRMDPYQVHLPGWPRPFN